MPAAIGRTLYVTNSATESGDANITRFAVNADGTIRPVDTVAAGHGARGMAITPGRRFAYVAASNANEINGYRIGPDGSLSRFATVPTDSPIGIVTSPDGHTLYVANQAAKSVTVFGVQRDGTLMRRATVSLGPDSPSPKDIAVTPDGRFLYIGLGVLGEDGPAMLTGLAIGAGGIPGRQVARAELGQFSGEVLTTPDGRFLYVVCTDTDDIFGYRIGRDGQLTPVSHLPAGDRAEGAAISPDGRLLFVAGAALADTGGPITGFTIGSDGALTPAGTPILLRTPAAVAFSRDGRHLYATDFETHNIITFDVARDGRLTTVQTQSSGGVQPAFQAITVL